MKKLLYFYLIINLLTCSEGGGVKENEIIKSWRLSEVVSVESEDAKVNEMMKEMIDKKLVSDGYVISFFPDNTYTELTGYLIEKGRWKMGDDNEIIFGEKKLKIEKIEKRKSKKFMIGTMELEEGIGLKLLWVEEAKMLKEFAKDPFHGTNNKWREKPSSKETTAQIKNRLLNYILHFGYIMKASVEREHNVVSFAHSMGIIRVYRGGIGRIKKSDIEQDWINCFYDEEDAIKAYELFSEHLTRGVYKGGTTGNWVKDDYKILMTIHDEIKNK